MKTIISIGIFIFLSVNLYSQLWKQYADSAASFFSGQKDTLNAIKYYSKAKEELEKRSYWTGANARISSTLGDLYYYLRQNEKAERLYLEVWKIEEILGKQTSDYATSCNNLGDVYRDVGQYEKAVPLYLDAKQIEEKLFGKNNIKYVTSCGNLGLLYRYLGQYKKAEPLLMEARQITENLFGKNHHDYAASCNSLGVLYKIMGQYGKAELLYLEAKQVVEDVSGKEDPEYVTSCNNLGILYLDMRQYSKSEPLLLEANQIGEKLFGKENIDYANSCSSLASLYHDMGQEAKAESLFLEARQIQEKLLGKEDGVYALYCANLGVFYDNMGRYEKAEPLLLEAMQIREKMLGKEHPEYAQSCIHLAALYADIGQYQKAESLYTQGMQIQEKLLGREHPHYASSCNGLGNLYMNMQQYRKAELLYLLAKQIREKLFGKDNPDYATSCDNLASSYQIIGQYEKAEPLLLEAKQIREKLLGRGSIGYATSCHNLGALYFEKGQYAKSERLYLEAKQIKEKVLGKLHLDYGLTCMDLAYVSWIMDQPLMAEKEFKECFSVNAFNMFSIFQFTNEKEKTAFIKNVSGADNGVYSFYISEKLPSEQPYAISLSHRNLILSASEDLQKQVFYSNDKTIINKYNEWTGLKKYLSVLYSKPVNERIEDVDAIEEKAAQLEKGLTTLSPWFKKQQQKIIWKDIQNNLQANEAAIEFASFHFYPKGQPTDSVFYIALVLKKDVPLPATIFLFTEKQLTKLLSSTGNKTTNDGVKQLYNSRGVVAGNNNIVNNQSIYDLVWKPLENELSGIKTIYFAPSGMLHRIAFAALPVKGKEVLSDRYKLVQLATTASVTDQTPTFVNSVDNVQLYGGINYDADSSALKQSARLYTSNTNKENTRSLPDDLTRSGSFSYLPGTKAEIETIKNEAKETQNHISALSEAKATEESFKALNGKASASVIHIATHGFFFPDPKEDLKEGIHLGFETSGNVFRQSDNPLFRSGLLFAGANIAWKGKPVEGIEDGILTAYEVSNMYLPNTKLVVLSACETALGDIQGSEGVYGLQRAFKIAGVQNLVMSLWKVPDAETAEFMQLFYKNMFAKQSISDAFYQAQTIMKNKYRDDPYKWAAWVLVR